MESGAFVQPAPVPGDPWREDPMLRAWLRRRVPAEVIAAISPELAEMGELAAGRVLTLQRADRCNEPRLTSIDAWGERIDRIDVTPLWREAEALAVRFGLTAIPYERAHGRWSRAHQFALVHLLHPVTDMYSCPLAMTDGAARALVESRDVRLIARAVPHLTSREPAGFWTSGQWMTESTGGSDVGLTRTRAERTDDGRWYLSGHKWFTSAATSQMALTLARPEGNPAGSRGLAMFYVETRDTTGRLQGIRVERLKDKLGTRKVPTAELTLERTPAELVGDTTGGIHAIEPMLRITRTWNSVCAVSFMRHGLLLAQDYSRKRIAFGAPLAEQPLHRETLRELEAETAGAFLLTFELVELVGAAEAGELEEEGAALLRLLTPLAKLVTGRQVVHVTTEIIESFGGAGYVEDTGLPTLLRDAQVLPIWEGTTNVLALDLLLRSDVGRGLAALEHRVQPIVAQVNDVALRPAANAIVAALSAARAWLGNRRNSGDAQAGARRFALTLGRAFELALLIEHARDAATPSDREYARLAVRYFLRNPVDRLSAVA